MHWMNFSDSLDNSKTSCAISYGREFWCRFTWRVRWSDLEKAREQRLQRYQDEDNCIRDDLHHGCGCDPMKLAILRMMMTVLKPFHWWGWLGYWGHQAFHLAFIWQLSRINGVSTSMTLLWPATKSEHYVWRSDSSLTKRIHPVSIFKPAISDHPVINTVLEILFANSTWWAIQYSFPIVILSVIDAKCSFLDPTLGQNFQECARLPAAERFVPCMSSPVSCQLVWTCKPSEESMIDDDDDGDFTSSDSQTKGSCRASLQCVFSYAPATSNHCHAIRDDLMMRIVQAWIITVIESDTVQNYVSA